MKHKLLNKLWLRVGMIVAVMTTALAATVKAETYSYSLTPDKTSTGSNSSSYVTIWQEFTYNSISWKMKQWNPSTLQIKTNQSSADSEFRFYNTSAFPGRITRVVITFSALTVTDASKLMFLGGTSEVTATTGGTAGTWLSASKTLTWTPNVSDNFTYFAFYQNGAAASGTNKLATTDAIVVTYETAPAYTITPATNNESYGTVSLSGSTIIANPATGYRVVAGDGGYTVTSGTATVINNGDNTFSVTPSTDCTVTINFEAIPIHTATFSINGTTLTESFAEGTAITFPGNPANVNGKSFVGWVTEAIDGTTNEVPAYVTSATMGNADVTYYAVFADVGTSYSETETEKTQTLQYDTWTYYGSTTDKSTYRLFHTGSYIESYAFDLSLLKKVIVYGGTFGGNNYKNLTIGDGTNVWKNVTVSGNSETGTNTYTDGNDLSGTGALRIICNSGTATGSGVRISKVEIFTKKVTTTYTNYCTTIPPSISADDVEIEYDATSGSINYTIENAPDPAGTLTASVPSGSWLTLGTVTSTTVPFTCQINLTDESPEETVTLTYTYGDNKTVTKYVKVTQGMPPAPALPVITVAENPFLFSTTATITCPDDNVETIQYSLDGCLTWQDYNGGTIIITSSLSLYARAIRWGHISEVAEYVIIKNLAETVVTVNGELNVDLNGGTNVNAGTLTAAVTYNNAAVQGATVTWSSSDTDVATINETTGAVTLLATGEVTFTATYAGNDDYAGAVGTKTITVVDSTPTITVITDEISVDAGEHDGTLALTYENLTISDMTDFGVQFYDAESNELTSGSEPDWIEVLVAEQDPAIGDGYVVSYFMYENEGADRTAYFKVYALDAENNVVFSNLVTVTQAAVTPTYTLATNITPGKRYIIVGKDGDYYKAMGLQDSNNRKTNAVTVNGQTATPQQPTNTYEFVIYGPDASENYTIYDVRGQGYLYAASSTSNYLRTQETNDLNGKWNISIASDGVATIVAQGSNSRNNMRYNPSSALFSCYSSGQQPVYLYEKDNDTPVATTASVTLNSSGYATFASTSVLDFLDAEDASYSAWQITGVNDTEITFQHITETIAAGTGILLKGSSGATINLNILPVGGATLSSTNKLVGITVPTQINSDEYFGLSGDKFVRVNGGTVPAGKALLPTSALTVKALTFSFDDATGIETIENGQLTIDDEIYNLAGQRLNKMQKGINIVNGKKILK